MDGDLQYTIEHTGITVRDLDESVKWYSENFGFTEEKRFDKPPMQLRGALLKLGNSYLEMLCPYESYKAQIPVSLEVLLARIGNSHIALAVNNILSSYENLRQNNAEILSEIIEGRFFFCRDINGILLEIREKK